MKRKIEEQLLKWKKDPNRKPLMIYGNKQVGKTYTALKFGEDEYSNIAYFNTENNIELYKILKKERVVDSMVTKLSILNGSTIIEDETLIIFDNLNDIEMANGLKTFGKFKNNYHVLIITSLKENLKLFKGEEFQYRMMTGLDFEEYLMAINNTQLIDFIKTSFKNNKKMPFHSLAMDYYNEYLMIGTLPEAVDLYIKEKNDLLLNSTYNKVIDSYKKEISSLDNLIDITRSLEVFDSIPFQLQKANKKFQYGLIKTGGRSKDYETSIKFLSSNGFVYKSYKISEIASPLSKVKDIDSFKLYLNDTGLLFNRLFLNKQKFLSNDNLRKIIIENSLALTLINAGFHLYYYQSEGKASIDFIVQDRVGKIIPIELVDKNVTKSKALTLFMKKFNVKEAVRITDENFSRKNGIKYIPIYAMFCLEEFL